MERPEAAVGVRRGGVLPRSVGRLPRGGLLADKALQARKCLRRGGRGGAVFLLDSRINLSTVHLDLDGALMPSLTWSPLMSTTVSSTWSPIMMLSPMRRARISMRRPAARGQARPV